MQSDHSRSDAKADSEYGQRDLAEFENDLKETRSGYSYFCLGTESGTRRGTVHLCIYGEGTRSSCISKVCVVCDRKVSEYRRIVRRRRVTGNGTGRIVVDENFQSSLPNVYAIGDLVKGMQLAHLASAQGMHVAEILAKESPSVDLAIVPGCVYTDPEIASAGITEDEAKEKGLEIKTGKFIMSANGKSLDHERRKRFY